MIGDIDVVKLAELWPVGLFIAFALVFGVPVVGWRLARVIGTDESSSWLEPRNLLRFLVLCFAALAFAVGVVILSVFAVVYAVGEITPSVGTIAEPVQEHHDKVYEQ